MALLAFRRGVVHSVELEIPDRREGDRTPEQGDPPQQGDTMSMSGAREPSGHDEEWTGLEREEIGYGHGV
jgi:hypothetical protein